MITDPTTAAPADPEVPGQTVEIDPSQPPIIVGAQLAEAVLPAIRHVSLEVVHPAGRADYWHGLMAALTATMSAQVGLVQSEGIMQACIGYGRRMAAEEAEARKGAH